MPTPNCFQIPTSKNKKLFEYEVCGGEMEGHNNLTLNLDKFHNYLKGKRIFTPAAEADLPDSDKKDEFVSAAA